jgi:hypothetical protein
LAEVHVFDFMRLTVQKIPEKEVSDDEDLPKGPFPDAAERTG